VASVTVHVELHSFEFFFFVHLIHSFYRDVDIAFGSPSVGLVVVFPVLQAKPTELGLAFGALHEVTPFAFLDVCLAAWALFGVANSP
jgi:hypothetical protein